MLEEEYNIQKMSGIGPHLKKGVQSRSKPVGTGSSISRNSVLLCSGFQLKKTRSFSGRTMGEIPEEDETAEAHPDETDAMIKPPDRISIPKYKPPFFKNISATFFAALLSPSVRSVLAVN